MKSNMETRQQLIDLRNQCAATFMNTLIGHTLKHYFNSTPSELAKQALEYANALVTELDNEPVTGNKRYVLELPICFITSQIDYVILRSKLENIFIGMRIETVNDLVTTGRERMKKEHGVGKKIIEMLANILGKYGIKDW